MINAKEAFRQVCKYVGENVTAASCREYDKRYGFFIAPPNSNTESRMYVGGSMFFVEKATGKVREEEPWKYSGESWRKVDI